MHYTLEYKWNVCRQWQFIMGPQLFQCLRLIFICRHCFVEAMLTNGTLHKGMYNIMQEWYNYINENIHIQADLIGE